MNEKQLIKDLKISQWMSCLFLLIAFVSSIAFVFVSNGIVSRIIFSIMSLSSLLTLSYMMLSILEEGRLQYIKIMKQLKRR